MENGISKRILVFCWSLSYPGDFFLLERSQPGLLGRLVGESARLVVFDAVQGGGEIGQVVLGSGFVAAAFFYFVFLVEEIVSGKPVVEIFVGDLGFDVFAFDEETGNVE